MRLYGERAGLRDALLLTAGHLVGVAVGEATETDELEHVEGTLLALGHADAAHLQAERDVLPRDHMGEQRVGLKDHADVAPVRGQAGHVVASDHDPALVRLFESGEQAQGRGFAAAGRPKQGHQLARRKGQRQAVERGDRAVAADESLEPDLKPRAFGHIDVIVGDPRVEAGSWCTRRPLPPTKARTTSSANANNKAATATAIETPAFSRARCTSSTCRLLYSRDRKSTRLN